MILIGADAKFIWTRARGLAPPAKLMNIIETVSAKAQPEESEPDHHQAHQPAQSQGAFACAKIFLGRGVDQPVWREIAFL